MTRYPSSSTSGAWEAAPSALSGSRLPPRLRRVGVLAVLFVVVAALVFRLGGGWRVREIAIAADGRRFELKTAADTVADALGAAGVSLGPWDDVSPPPAAEISSGLTIVVRRAVEVFVDLDGREVRVLTAAPTVGELLAGSRLPIGPEDKVSPGRDTPVTPGLKVTVTRVVRSYQYRDEPIPYPTVKQEDMTLDLGRTEVVQEGRNGRMTRLLSVTYEDGRPTAVEELSRMVLAEPEKRIVRVGTAGDIVRDGKTIHFLKALSVTATAYEPGPVSCGPNATGYTSVGLKATKGVIAVDPRVIPLWSKVYVDGYGYAVAGDTGSAIKGSRIDVCFDTLEEARSWGVKRVKVYILQLPGK